jgi:hypothetical protein
MRTLTSTIFKLFTAAFLALMLVACGGGGGGGGDTGSSAGVATGSVSVALTDKPADLSEIDQILVTIKAVELFREDGEKSTLYDGRPRGPFDLLKLENESRPLAFRREVPVGTYCKIRLTLTDLELVFNTGEPNFHPKLPGNSKLDLNARDCFEVRRGDTVYVQLDMDARSIHIVETKNGTSYNFRPVVFIDAITRQFPGKLVRLEEGVIRRLDSGSGKFLLCGFSYGDRINGDIDDCMIITVNRSTSAFDNVDDDGINRTTDGDAIPLDELLVPERVGTEPVTVVGKFDLDESADSEYPVLSALVVELGGMLNLGGTVTSGASDIRFNMEVDSGEGISTDGDLPVALQPAPAGGNGTKILNRRGDPLTTDAIIPPRTVMVDGVLILPESDPDYLNSALVIVDTSDAIPAEMANGTIVRLGENGFLLEAGTFPCEDGTGSFNASFDAETVVYLASSSGSGFVDTASLAVGQKVDINGKCEATTLAADFIIITED